MLDADEAHDLRDVAAASFDLVVCLEGAPDPAELRRVLADGGVLVATNSGGLGEHFAHVATYRIDDLEGSGAGDTTAQIAVATVSGTPADLPNVVVLAGAQTRAELQARARAEELETEIAQLREQLVRAETEAALVPGLREELDAQRGPTAVSLTPEQRMARAEQTVSQMSSSISWKLTKPLRSLKRRLRG